MVFVSLMLWDVSVLALPDLPPTPKPSDQSTIQVEVTKLPPDELTPDAIFTGSLAFVGLALFSTLLSRIHNISESTPPRRRYAAYMVIGGAFGMVGIGLGIAASAYNFQFESLTLIINLLFVPAIVYLCGYAYLILSPRSNTPE